MILTVLTDNNASSGLFAEHGLSYFIVKDDKKFLFDTGRTNIFLKNASLLGFDPFKQLDAVILSHGHYDHGNGLTHVPKTKLITHPNSFAKRFKAPNQKPLGLSLSLDEAKTLFDLELSKSPILLSPNLFYLGEIPRIFDFEGKTPVGFTQEGEPDYVIDDSALAFVKNDELSVISGCAHSGICNIIEHAKNVCGLNKVKTVIGGFHLKKEDTQLKETANYLLENNVEQVFPAHCTSLEAKIGLSKYIPVREVKTGLRLVF